MSEERASCDLSALLQRLRLCSGGVSVVIVVLFKIIDVHHKDRHWPFLTYGLTYRYFVMLVKEAPVIESVSISVVASFQNF